MCGHSNLSAVNEFLESQVGSHLRLTRSHIEVKDKLKALHSELDAGVRTVQGYTVEAAVAD